MKPTIVDSLNGEEDPPSQKKVGSLIKKMDLDSLLLFDRLKLYGSTLSLAYQSFGVVYGDLSISPIYVYKSTFEGSLGTHRDEGEILGVLSLIVWTLTIIPLCKYCFLVLAADDRGEGGTFALYSLLCRHLKAGLLSTTHGGHDGLSSYRSVSLDKETRSGLLIREFFQKHQSSRIFLLLVVLVGTSMIIGDGVLTPAMSVLSAVSGIQIRATNLHQGYIVLLSCVILVGLFAIQQYGTHRVGYLFAPIMISWLVCLTGVGIYNIIHWNPRVVYALSPHYAYKFFKQNGKAGWNALGGILLCTTGAEAMFADLGHFSPSSIRIAFLVVVYPCLVVAYMGEAAYLSKNVVDVNSSFFKAVPEAIFWPVFCITTLATVVGSQAMISASFSIISQCRALRCFPRVKIKYTSSQIYGQIYIPEVNWTLMIMSLAVVIGFRDTHMIGNAYGLVVITSMFVTTCLMFLVICSVWKRHILLATAFLLVLGSIELVFFSVCLLKVPRGGWLPLLFSVLVVSLMCVWQYGTSTKQAFEVENKVSLDNLLAVAPSLGIVRVPGVAIIYSSLAGNIPPMFSHFLTTYPAVHQIVVFVTLESLMVPKVPHSDDMSIGRIGSEDSRIFWCIVRYGYKDLKDSYNFETRVIDKLVEFLQGEDVHDKDSAVDSEMRRRKSKSVVSSPEELEELMEAKEVGVAYMLGNTYVVATKSSSAMKKFVINVVYDCLRRNSRRPAIALGIPQSSLIEVGVGYYV